MPVLISDYHDYHTTFVNSLEVDMNERIKQLMDQAGIDVEAVENLGEMPTALKFAELIVRECADICYNRDYAYGSAYGEQIEKHFGVQE
jgi:hypothetical protein